LLQDAKGRNNRARSGFGTMVGLEAYRQANARQCNKNLPKMSWDGFGYREISIVVAGTRISRNRHSLSVAV
jgi:hypothetical protein